MPARLHPTLLIGYGDYGKNVLHQFLSTTAAHGLLPWELQATTSGLSRKIQSLALIWINDQADEEQNPLAWESGLLGELYHQIKVIPESSSELLHSAVFQSVSELLSLQQQSSDRQLRLGLDIILLLHPKRPSDIGMMMGQLRPVLTTLQDDPKLRATGEGARILNTLLVLDFEGFWRTTPEAQSLRRAVRHTLQSAENEYQLGKPGFSRVYLMDGDSPEGHRTDQIRVEEISLFLEFLLYEGQRDDPTLRNLVQRPTNVEPPIMSLGIRMVERSSNLLSRLAAAAFGVEWLRYLRSESGDMVGAGIEEALQPFQANQVQKLLGTLPDQEVVQPEVRALEQTLLALPFTPTWGEQVLGIWVTHWEHLRRQLGAWGSAQRQAIIDAHIGGLHGRLVEEISIVLSQHKAPTLKDILLALEHVLDELRRPIMIPPDPPHPSSKNFDFVANQYAAFVSEQVHREQLKGWWYRMAGLTACGLTPILTKTINQFSDFRPLASQGWATLLASLFIAGIAVYQLGHRWADPRIERAHRFFTDPEQGRFSAVLRAATTNGGEMTVPFQQAADQAVVEVSNSLRNQVARELERIRARLGARLDEAEWLHQQLTDFLRQNGVDPETKHLSIRHTPIRTSLNQPDDVKDFLLGRRPERAAFQEIQEQEQPFLGWEHRYNSKFLQLLSFLDAHARNYPDPIHRDSARGKQAERAHLVAQQLRRMAGIHTSFTWRADLGVVEQRFAVLAANWKPMQEISLALREIGIPDSAWRVGTSDERCYLLSIALHIHPDALQ